MSIRVVPNGFELDGEVLGLFSASVQYWRLDRALWGPILDNVRQMGFKVIETYIPWDVHETGPETYDFGATDLQKDVGHFLDLCHDRGLRVLVRPGPHINAELRDFGFPRRVLADPDVQARTAQGTLAVYHFPFKPFPVPSYASDAFYTAFSRFMDALAPVLRQRIYPRGSVVGIQADNELSYFFRISAYDLDYAPCAIQQYRRFLADRYHSIDDLNRAYRSSFTSFGEVAPPREFHGTRPEDLPWYLDWTHYKEYQLTEALRRLAVMYREDGLGELPTFQNYPGPYTNVPNDLPYRTPFSVAKSEQVLDVVGVDSYPLWEDYEVVKQSVQYAVGSSRLPYVPEFGAGAVGWRRPPHIEEHEFATLALLMHGIKGIGFYMIVDRDRWLGSPVTVNNRIRQPEYGLYQRFNQLLDDIDILRLKRESQCLLLAGREYERLASATALLPVPSRSLFNFKIAELYLNEADLGLGDQVAYDHFLLWKYLYAGLTQAGFTFDLSDTDALTLERLSAYPAVVVPSFTFMARETQAVVRQYVEAGGTLVLGPRCPLLDESMHEWEDLARSLRRPVERIKSGQLDLGAAVREAEVFDAEPLLSIGGRTAAYRVPVGRGAMVHFGFLPAGPADSAAGEIGTRLLDAAGIAPSSPSSNKRVEMVWHSGGGRRVLFACNPTAERQTTTLTLPGRGRLQDRWGTDHRAAATEHLLSLDPYTIRIWEVLL
jgi:beta-galactosidase